MKRTIRLSNVAPTQNAWSDVVRGCLPSNEIGFSAPSLGLGYQPEHKLKVHSGRKGTT